MNISIKNQTHDQLPNYMEKAIIEFLEKNGFNKVDNNSYSNNLCNVSLGQDGDHYVIANNEGDTMYSPNLNIYWLVGALTYLGFMDKNYKQ